MRKIIYYVASSIDGYISGLNDDISGFTGTGNGIDQYMADLADFDTVIMGRNTYEFGYRFGLQPGQPAYPHMTHYIFSETLSFENKDPKVNVLKPELSALEHIQQQPGTAIYLCGGGQLAGWLLDNRKINTVKMKLNPFIQGEGTRLFGNSKTTVQLELEETEKYDHGLQIITYTVKYNNA